jgi:hypothetical protein
MGRLRQNPARASEVEVRFIPEEPNRTRVELEHRHLERCDEGWRGCVTRRGSPERWDLELHRFVQLVEHTAANG